MAVNAVVSEHQFLGGVDRVQFKTFPLAILFLGGQLTANGASSVELTVETPGLPSKPLQLPRNAVVDPGFKVTVSAGRADWTRCKDVGQLHQQAIDRGISVVVDFGVLRTVAGVGLTDTGTFRILTVKQWTGTGFAAQPVFDSDGVGSFDAAVVFNSQIRSERLQVDLVKVVDPPGNGIAIDSLLVQLPDLPADLDLRINGGPPVWTFPGPVTGTAPGWAPGPAGLASHDVDLTAALNALLGDPTASIDAPLDLHVVLTARVPGALDLQLAQPVDPLVRYLAQVALPPGQETLTFSAEGRKVVPLPLPPWVGAVEKVSLTVAAKLPPERTVPPLGPDAQPVDANALGGPAVPLAEMALDPERAAAVALTGPSPGDPLFASPVYGLGELVGVRLPLRAETGGAEVRALLLAAGDDGPGAPVDGGASKPVNLEAAPAAGGDDVWSTFSFARPLPLDPTKLPFVAVLLTRGRARWSLTGAAAAGQVLFGPPDGPWQPLPPLGDLSALRGRIRMVGHAAPEQAIAPLQLGLGGPGRTAVTPMPKGVAVEVAGTAIPTIPAGGLEVVSLVAGTVTLSNVVVRATRLTPIQPLQR